MPDTYGKRQRKAAQQRKAAEREERRLARNQRREARAAGISETPEKADISTDEDSPET